MRRLDEAKGIKRELPKLLKIEKNKKVLMIGNKQGDGHDDGKEPLENSLHQFRSVHVGR